MTAGPLVCRDLVELVTDHLEGALGPTVHTTVDDHLRGCAGCTAYLAQIRATVAFCARHRHRRWIRSSMPG
jgi:hypothetical protein